MLDLSPKQATRAMGIMMRHKLAGMMPIGPEACKGSFKCYPDAE